MNVRPEIELLTGTPVGDILAYLDLLDEDRVLEDIATVRAYVRALRACALDVQRQQALALEERHASELAEGQQLRAIEDFRLAYDRATALTNRLDGAYLETITTLARAVEARDAYTGRHVERVRHHTLAIAAELGLGGDVFRQLEFGAVLHDVGKIGVADAILGKPGPLTVDEWTDMRQHPAIGKRILEGIEFLVPAIDAVAHHHERWDGRGYPYALRGTSIPLAGRIVAVADAYDAMVSDRPYRPGLALDFARGEIVRGRGTQFDPDIADAFLSTLGNWTHRARGETSM